MASDTHKDAELASARADPAAVKKIREFTGNNLSHEEAKRLLVECDGDVQVALNRIADGTDSPTEASRSYASLSPTHRAACRSGVLERGQGEAQEGEDCKEA